MHQVQENSSLAGCPKTHGLFSDVEEYMYNPERASSIMRDASLGCNVVGVTMGYSMLPNQKCVLNIFEKISN